MVLDLSAVYHSPALGVLMACAAAWLQSAVEARHRNRILLVVDEAWAILGNLRTQGMAVEDGPRLSGCCVRPNQCVFPLGAGTPSGLTQPVT